MLAQLHRIRNTDVAPWMMSKGHTEPISPANPGKSQQIEESGAGPHRGPRPHPPNAARQQWQAMPKLARTVLCRAALYIAAPAVCAWPARCASLAQTATPRAQLFLHLSTESFRGFRLTFRPLPCVARLRATPSHPKDSRRQERHVPQGLLLQDQECQARLHRRVVLAAEVAKARGAVIAPAYGPLPR